MAEYLGINIVVEGFLLPLAKMSLQVNRAASDVARLQSHSLVGAIA